MLPKTSTVEISGTNYLIRKMVPTAASYIHKRLIFAAFKVGSEAKQRIDDAPEPAADVQTPEQRAKGLYAIASMQLSFEDLGFIQTTCMKVISRVESIAGNEAAMPIMQDSGQWAAADIADDGGLIDKLTSEAVAFNISSFFA